MVSGVSVKFFAAPAGMRVAGSRPELKPSSVICTSPLNPPVAAIGTGMLPVRLRATARGSGVTLRFNSASRARTGSSDGSIER